MSDYVATLTASKPQLAVNVPFGVAAIVVTNPTASAVLVRVGAPDIPGRANANRIIPAGASASYPVTGLARDFGLALDAPSAIGAATSSQSGLFDTATIQFLDASEAVPAFGSYSFLSLSTSELMPLTAFAGVTTLVTLDIGAWGGLLVYVSPSATGGQGVIAVNVSSDKFNFQPYGSFAFWPGVPAVVTVPRVARYVQIVLNATAIAGEPAIGGTVAVRATLAEIQQLSYNPTGAAISRTFSLAALASQQFRFVTAGLPAVSLAAIAVNPTTAGAAVTFLVEASSDLVNWRQVTARDQKMSQGVTLYRAMGNLDLFIQVTIFETDAVSAINGVLYASIPREADLGSILNTIQQSLGDKNAPSNTNQDIYHLLDTIRSTDVTINGHVATMDANEAAYLPTINTNTGNTATSTAATNAGISTANGHLANMETYDSNIPAMKTDLDALVAGYNGIAAVYSGSTSLSISAWTGTGVAINPGYRVVAIMASVRGNGGIATAGIIGVGQGHGAAVLQSMYIVQPAIAVASFGGPGPAMSYQSIRGAGVQIFNNSTQIWLLQTIYNTAAVVDFTVVAVP